MTPDAPGAGEAGSPVAGNSNGRDGCVSILLWWLVAANTVAALSSPVLLAPMRKKSMPDFPEWVVWPIAGASVFGALSALALLRRKKWGFYGYVLAQGTIFALNVYAGVGVGASALGLIGTAVLFLALHGVHLAGGTQAEWSRLK